MNELNERQMRITFGCIILFVGIWAIGLLCSNIPVWMTEHRVESIARGDWSGPNEDWWEHAIHITEYQVGGVKARKVVSDGPDFIAGTPDDIAYVEFKTDYAYKFGVWTTEKAGLFVKGAIQGLKSKD